MLDQEIANLLAYAESALMLDESDIDQAKSNLSALLKLDDVSAVEPDAELVDSCATPTKLVEPLIAYAAEKGICAADATADLRAAILDAISLRPSEINDLFADTYAVNKQKALDFLYDYSVKNGYVDLDLIAKNDRWEAKELKSHIELIINLMPESPKRDYPKCALCKENEGYKDHANMRGVVAEINGEEWRFNYTRHQYFERHGVLTAVEHRPMPDGKAMLENLAHAVDFVGADGFVCTNAVAENSGAKNTVHEHYQTGYKTPPMLRTEIKQKLKSKEYPYLEMGLLDWYCTVIRFSHSNFEKTVEFAVKLQDAWKNYSDARIVNPDGKKNFCNFVVRKINGKYVFDAILRSNGMKKASTSPEYSEIKADALSITDILGYFVLPNKLSEELKAVQLYLDGTMPFEPGNLPPSMKPFEKMIARMLKDQGGTVTKLEAKLNLHDEVDLVCEKILKSTAVFDSENITDFLDKLDIAVL